MDCTVFLIWIAATWVGWNSMKQWRIRTQLNLVHNSSNLMTRVIICVMLWLLSAVPNHRIVCVRACIYICSLIKRNLWDSKWSKSTKYSSNWRKSCTRNREEDGGRPSSLYLGREAALSREGGGNACWWLVASCWRSWWDLPTDSQSSERAVGRSSGPSGWRFVRDLLVRCFRLPALDVMGRGRVCPFRIRTEKNYAEVTDTCQVKLYRWPASVVTQIFMKFLWELGGMWMWLAWLCFEVIGRSPHKWTASVI